MQEPDDRQLPETDLTWFGDLGDDEVFGRPFVAQRLLGRHRLGDAGGAEQ